MDPSVPRGAALILDFLSVPEARGSYETVFGDHQLPTPITAITLDELMAAQRGWAKVWGSAAAGRYQFMRATLAGLQRTLRLKGSEPFAPDLQDRLAYQLLKQRGYARFVARRLSIADFGLQLAQEWASLPVLAPVKGAHRMVGRGETYYAGDRINHALVRPETVEVLLGQVLGSGSAKSVAPGPAISKPVLPPPVATPVAPAPRLSLLAELENFILNALEHR